MRERLDRLIGEMLEKGILYEEARQEFERRFITGALARSKGSLSRAADLLGIHRNTLSRKIIAYRITRAPLKARGARRPRTPKSAA
ncbi:MAG: helix-turn-helix domain-containing protein [Vicinamibacterales bacterium]|nr:histidine kinase [Acidobacteriota bacterium]MDP6373933.1 helix-turn-helix domain-containing protein [Vicinamibacterales bacterium]MDP6610529.1 helix-turn-helix domain-containing protein [Vicinamibacterales bacterium]MDP7471691.1 helix-turn-helix domain-containing protein [Vicinamibacterales bacterium]MDP7671373.1 helix-turn-helix domain-containing protein [Vicinamibacterales bacterium]